jgi:thioredoxin-like negative regulator of GroEL
MPTVEDGRHAINQGNLQHARLIFEAILQENPRSAEAWLGLGEVFTDADRQRICYENVLVVDKNNRTARERLRYLEPESEPLRGVLMAQESVGIFNQSASNPGGQASEVMWVAIGLLISLVAFGLGSLAVYWLFM